jgi:hypothetical protein
MMARIKSAALLNLSRYRHPREPSDQQGRHDPPRRRLLTLSHAKMRQRNNRAMGVRSNEGSPARWRLVGLDMKEAAN